VRNNECTIYITTKDGERLQSFRKGKTGWVLTSGKGIEYLCTAEQFISHILPPLAFGHAKVIVEPDKKSQEN
jgi:hypothetical protein